MIINKFLEKYPYNQNAWFEIGKLYFDLNNPFLTVIFNKSVDLEYLDPSKQILDFISQSDRVNMIRKNLKQTYLNASKRRPKKFLET